MSNTYKDRPYWVRTNQPVKDTIIKRHRHENFGKPIYRYRPQLDTNGEPVTEEYITDIARWVDGHLIGFETVKRERIIYERYIHSYTVDHCTIDEPETSRSRYLGPYLGNKPCTKVVFTNKYNRPRKVEKREYHATARSKEKSQNRNVVKVYNTGEDIETMNWETPTTRENMHHGWWD